MPQRNQIEPIQINENDILPNWDWDRVIPAPGPMAIDFEERVDFRRLHRYRLGRTQKALAESDLGAILCFDNNNIQYIKNNKSNDIAAVIIQSPNSFGIIENWAVIKNSLQNYNS